MSEDILEEIRRNEAHVRKIAWIKFAIVAAVTAALVGMWIGIAYAFSYVEGLVKDTGTGIVWMSISGALVGNLALYAVFDTLASYHSAPIKILKTVLKIAGIGIVVVSNFFVMLISGLGGIIETDPMIIGLYGTGFMGATICGLAFYWNQRIKIAPNGVDPLAYFENNTKKVDSAARFARIAYPFVSFASLFFGYVLSVIFSIIGNAVHSFFYFWFGFLLCLGAIIASVVVYFKRIKNSKKRKYSSSSKSSTSYTDNDYSTEKKVDAEHKDGKRRMERVFYSERLLPYASDMDILDIDWETPPKINNYNYWWNSSSISVSGKIKCTIRKDDASYAEDICQKILDRTAEIIEDKVESILDELHREYSNYGEYDINCSGVRIGTCKFQ